MKLRDIILKEDEYPDFDTEKSSTDDTTGQITWDVNYTPIKSLNKNLEELNDDFKEVLEEYPTDRKLEEIYKKFASVKREMRKHISRQYS